jgi:hypothetical protein
MMRLYSQQTSFLLLLLLLLLLLFRAAPELKSVAFPELLLFKCNSCV